MTGPSTATSRTCATSSEPDPTAVSTSRRSAESAIGRPVHEPAPPARRDLCLRGADHGGGDRPHDSDHPRTRIRPDADDGRHAGPGPWSRPGAMAGVHAQQVQQETTVILIVVAIVAAVARRWSGSSSRGGSPTARRARRRRGRRGARRAPSAVGSGRPG